MYKGTKFFKSDPKKLLCKRLNVICQNAINAGIYQLDNFNPNLKEVKEIGGMLICSNIIKLYLDKRGQLPDISCEAVANEVTDIIKDRPGKNHFYKDIRGLLKPYLQEKEDMSLSFILGE